MALTLQQRIDDAKAAYHELLVGRAPKVVVDQNGERVEYTQANRAALAQYIADLEDQLAGTRRTRGPMKTWLS